MHAAAGAKMGIWFGCALPDDFGDAAAEYRYARDSVALIDKNHRACFSFTGPDRVRYLNAILTNNIKDLRAGQGVVSLLLNPQGHILAEIETYAFADRLFCVSYAMIRERLIEWLEKYIIMDDVTLTDETTRYGTLALEGPKAAAIVRELTGVDVTKFGDLSSHDASVGAISRRSIPGRLVKRSPGGVPGAEFVAESENLPELWQILSEAAQMGKKLYVGNLPYSVSDSDLQQMFAAHGSVVSAQVIMDRDTGRSKGFGFVEMKSDQEAQAAIAGLSGKEVNGRALTVNEARPMASRDSNTGFKRY